MNECPELDAIATIGSALNWEVIAGLRHLQTCDLCRERMDMLRGIHTAFAAMEPVESEVLSDVTDALRSVARSKASPQPAPVWAHLAEAALAGATAVALVVSTNIPIENAATAVITFAAGGALVVAARTSRLFRTTRAQSS